MLKIKCNPHKLLLRPKFTKRNYPRRRLYYKRRVQKYSQYSSRVPNSTATAKTAVVLAYIRVWVYSAARVDDTDSELLIRQ